MICLQCFTFAHSERNHNLECIIQHYCHNKFKHDLFLLLIGHSDTAGAAIYANSKLSTLPKPIHNSRFYFMRFLVTSYCKSQITVSTVNYAISMRSPLPGLVQRSTVFYAVSRCSELPELVPVLAVFAEPVDIKNYI